MNEHDKSEELQGVSTCPDDNALNSESPIDKNVLAQLLDSYEENAKTVEKEKDEDGSTIRKFENKYVKNMLTVFCVGMVLYHVYALLFRLTTPLVLYSIHWGMGLLLVFLYYPISKKLKAPREAACPFTTSSWRPLSLQLWPTYWSTRTG